MEHCTLIRTLRLRYGLTLSELSRAVGVSPQLFSRIELGESGQTPHHEALARNAFAAVISQHRKRLDALEQELAGSPWLFAPATEGNEHEI